MYFPNRFCCICLCDKSDLKPILDVDYDGLSHYNKLTSSIAEMDFKEMNNQRLICGECCVTLNTVYNFRQTCLRSKTNLTNQILNHVDGTIKIKQEIKCENEDSLDISDSNCLLKIKSDPDDISSVSNCCICLCDKSDLKHMYDVDNDGVSHYNKLTSSIAEMCFEELNDQRLICRECCVTLNTVYNFRQTCLRSKTTLVSQLQTSSHVIDTNNCFVNVANGINIKKEVESDYEDSMEDNSATRVSNQTEDGRVNVPAVPIKKEYESEEGYNYPCKIETEDHVNGRENADVKVEDVERETNKDEYTGNFVYLKFEKKPIENHGEMGTENPLEVNNEQKSKSKDGSTSKRKIPEEDKKHQCEICQKRFAQKRHLTVHRRKHIDNKTFQCQICQKIFTQNSRLTSHMKFHNGVKTHECEICKKKFITKLNLITHMRIHTGERPYECEVCKKTFSRKDTLNLHSRLHSDERSHECQICQKKFITKNHLSNHMLVHSTEKPYECEVCKKRFHLQAHVTSHMVMHSDVKPFECGICKKRFNRNSNLITHMLSHSRKKPYECEICKKGFTRKSYIATHMLIHSDERPYECEICKKRFNRPNQLTMHLLKHAIVMDGSHKCAICGENFFQRNNLVLHLRNHSGDKPYECKVCKEWFLGREELNNHMQIHSSGSTYECEVCNELFFQSIDLSCHMRMHSEERPYGCEVCKKRFHQKSHLNVHMQIHSGERLYECNICSKKFSRKSNLKIHMFTHSSDKPFECKLCKKRFNQKSHLNSHLKKYSETPCNAHMLSDESILPFDESEQPCDKLIKKEVIENDDDFVNREVIVKHEVFIKSEII